MYLQEEGNLNIDVQGECCVTTEAESDVAISKECQGLMLTSELGRGK